MRLMNGLNQNPAGPSCGELQVFDWSPPDQFLNQTSGGRHDDINNNNNNITTTPAAASIHPLVPLLLYSDSLLPPSSPYSQPIRAAHVQSGTRPCNHGNSIASRPAVKKPLNAFMLYMKERRQEVVQEGQKESAAINRILGRRWNALSRSEQSKYYDLAQKERILHMKLYPGWSARDNYGKRKKKVNQQPTGNSSGP